MIPYNDGNGNIVEPKLYKLASKVAKGTGAVIGKTARIATTPLNVAGRMAGQGLKNAAGSLYYSAFSGDPLVESVMGLGGNNPFAGGGNNISANGRVMYQNIRLPNGQIRRQKIVLPQGAGLGGGFGGSGGVGLARIGGGRDIVRALQSVSRQLTYSNKMATFTLNAVKEMSDRTRALVRLTGRSITIFESVNRNILLMKNAASNRNLSDDAYRTSFELFLNDKFNELKSALSGMNNNNNPPNKKKGIFGQLMSMLGGLPALLAGLLSSKLGFLKNLPNLFSKNGLKSLAGMIMNAGKGALLAALGLGAKGVSKAGELLAKGKPFLKTVGQKIGSGYSALKGKLSGVTTVAKNAAMAVGDKAVKVGKAVASGAKGAIARAAAVFSNIVKNGGWKRLLSAGGRAALSTLRFLPGVGIIASAAWVGIELYDVMKNLTKDIDFGHMFTDIGDSLLSSFDKVKSKIASVFGFGDNNNSTSPEIQKALPFGMMMDQKNSPVKMPIEYLSELNKMLAGKPSGKFSMFPDEAFVKRDPSQPNFTTEDFVRAGESSGDYGAINKNDSKNTKSYGAYQFNTGGTVQDFLKSSKFSSEFDSVKPGSDEFDLIWQNLAESSDEFRKEQDEYFTKKFKNEARKIYKESTGMEAGKLTEAVITSMKIRGDNVLKNALKGVRDINAKNDKEIANALLNESSKNVRGDYKTGIGEGTTTVERLQQRIQDDIARINGTAPVKFVKGAVSKVGGVLSDIADGNIDFSSILNNAIDFLGENIDSVAEGFSNIYSDSAVSPVQEMMNEKIKMNMEAISRNAGNGSGGTANVSVGGTNVASTPITNNTTTTIINNEIPSIVNVLNGQLW